MSECWYYSVLFQTRVWIELCRREVSLADAIKKPIIPLKFDSDMKWPPEGPMSLVFASQVFIEIPSNSGEKNASCWDCPQFGELVQKINHHLKPAVPQTPAPPPESVSERAPDRTPSPKSTRAPSPATAQCAQDEQAPESTEHLISQAGENCIFICFLISFLIRSGTPLK